MPTPIEVTPLGLLATLFGGQPQPPRPTPGGIGSDATALSRVPRGGAPASNRGLFAGLFNTGDKPSGYTPEDVQKIIGDRAGYYQNFPIVPMWNGGRGAGGILPGIANFGAGFMGAHTQGQQQRNAQENERIRREAAARASGAGTLPEAVSALQAGSPEQASVALQFHLQNLAKEQERRRQAAIMEQIYGAPPAPAPSAAPAPTDTAAAPNTPASVAHPAPPAPPAPAAPPTQPRTNWPFPTDAPPSAQPSPAPPASLQNPGTDFMMPPAADGVPSPQPGPQHSFAIEGMTPQQMAQLPLNRPQQPGAAPAPQAAPGQAPAQPPQPDPIVQIGSFRLPLSEARRRAAMGRAQGIDVKPLEEAIQLAEAPLLAASRERGKALGEAQTGLPQSIQAAQSTIEKIDEISNDPQLERIIGWSAYNPMSYLPYTAEQRGLVARIQQVQGRFFLQAFDALRGGGQITEKEGEKAQAAIARIMDTHQDMRSYRTALEDARREVWSLTNIARTRAGLAPVPYVPPPPAVGSVRDGYRFNGGDPANPASWQRVQ